jgi:hypothetical protein
MALFLAPKGFIIAFSGVKLYFIMIIFFFGKYKDCPLIFLIKILKIFLQF